MRLGAGCGAGLLAGDGEGNGAGLELRRGEGLGEGLGDIVFVLVDSLDVVLTAFEVSSCGVVLGELEVETSEFDCSFLGDVGLCDFELLLISDLLEVFFPDVFGGVGFATFFAFGVSDFVGLVTSVGDDGSLFCFLGLISLLLLSSTSFRLRFPDKSFNKIISIVGVRMQKRLKLPPKSFWQLSMLPPNHSTISLADYRLFRQMI